MRNLVGPPVIGRGYRSLTIFNLLLLYGSGVPVRARAGRERRVLGVAEKPLHLLDYVSGQFPLARIAGLTPLHELANRIAVFTSLYKQARMRFCLNLAVAIGLAGPQFEVASGKPGDSTPQFVHSANQLGGRYTATK